MSLDQLKEEMINRMIARLPTQKLLCDQNENISIPRSFDNVEQMAKNIVYSKHGIIIGDPMYFLINGRPITIASQYIYQVVV